MRVKYPQPRPLAQRTAALGVPALKAEVSEGQLKRVERRVKPRVPVKDDRKPPMRKLGLNERAAYPLPKYRRSDLGGAYTYTSDLTEADFLLMRRCFATAHPVESLGSEIATLDIQVFGRAAGADPEDPFPEMSERAQYQQRLVDQWLNVEQLLKKSPWSMPMGLLFWQLRFALVENIGVVCEFADGLRWPLHAGGDLALSADQQSIIKQRQYNHGGNGTKVEEESYSLDNWLVMKPGGDPSPIGCMDLAWRFRKYAGDYDDVEYNSAIRAKHYTLPYLMLRYAFDAMKSTDLEDHAGDVKDAAANFNPGDILAMGDKLMLDYAEPGQSGGEYLDSRETRIEGKASRDLLLTALLSDTRATGPTGSSKEARTSQNTAKTSWANFMSHVLDQALKRNTELQEMLFPGEVPALKEGEAPPFIRLRLPEDRPEAGKSAKEPAADVVPEDKRPDAEGRETKDVRKLKPVA